MPKKTSSREETLSELLKGSDANSDLKQDFLTALKTALDNDPSITSRRYTLQSKLAKIDTTFASKDFQVSGSLYGGVEDITDEVAGLALVLSASKVVYDGVIDA